MSRIREPAVWICRWCANRTVNVCSFCQEEGKYRYFVPRRLSSWEDPPELPPYRELVDSDPYLVRVLYWLAIYYSDPSHRDPPR